jgi:PAT family beta-lactamase induction signal transducer AmpG
MTGGRVRPLDLALFAAVYAVQGVVFAYFINYMPGYMTAAGVSRATVGTVQSIVMVPFVLKFLVGPISDGFSPFGLGHRVPYIVAGLALQAGALAALTRISPSSSLGVFSTVALLAVLGMAVYDTCCDGLIVDVTPPEARSRVQGIVVASRFLSATIFTLGFGFWLGKTGNGPRHGDGVLLLSAALTLLPLALVLIGRRSRATDEAEPFQWAAFGVLLRKRSLILLAFGALYSMTGYGVETNLESYYKTALGMNDWHVGRLGAIRNLGRVAGAALVPLLFSRIGRRPTLIGGLIALAAATAGQALAGGLETAGILGFLFGLANGWDDAMFFVLAMEASDPRMAASTYALFMAASNVSIASSALFSKGVAAFGGRYRPVLVLFSLLALAALPLANALSRPAESKDKDAAAR